MSQDTTARFYTSGEYHQQNKGIHEEHAKWKANYIQKVMNKQGLAPQTICEIGCGTGDILCHLKQAMPSVECDGFDISHSAIEIAQKKGSSDVRFYCEDFLKKGVPRKKYDVILLIDLIEHLEDIYSFLRFVKQYANHVIIHFPLDISVQGVLFNRPLVARRDLGHIHYFTKDTALNLLKDCGYNVGEYFYTPVTLGVSQKKAFKTRVANIPRKLTFWWMKDLCVRLFGGYSLMVVGY